MADQALRVRTPAGAFSLFLHGEDDRFVSATIAKKGVYERSVTALICALLRPGDFFIDIGANLGWFSLLAARRVGPSGRVFAFEPEPRNFALLQRNIALNCFDQIQAFACALGDEPGTLTLHLSERNFGDHSIASRPGGVSIQTPVEPLDDVLARAAPQGLRPSLVKMDVQGAEVRVLAGAEGLLSSGRDVIWIVEASPGHLEATGASAEALFASFAKAGFVAFRLHKKQRRSYRMDQNALRAWILRTSALGSDAHDDFLFAHPDGRRFAGAAALSKPWSPLWLLA